MQLETERLLLAPLTAMQMRLWTENLPALEKELDCRYQAEPIKDRFLEIVRAQTEKMTADEANY